MVLDDQTLFETRQRFDERKTEREKTLARMRETPSLLRVDSPERVQKRLKRLGVDVYVRGTVLGVGREPVPASPPEEAQGTDLRVFERIMGSSDLMSITFLELGVRVSRAVGRVMIRDSGGRTIGFGTGFMVSPHLMLTNHHVLGDDAEAARSSLEFNFQAGLDGRILPTAAFPLDPEAFFITDPQLDFTLVAVKETGLDGGAPRDFGWLPLVEDQGKVLLGEPLNIIQHPNGEPKQLALRENRLVDLLPSFLHYHTDTAPGSSGSPVFSDDWEVVALHHSGVPKRDAQGRLLTRDDRVWTPEMGEHRIAWIANEGIRISRIVQHVKKLDFPAAMSALRAQMFNPPTGGPEARALPPSTAGGARARLGSLQPELSGDGSVVWTIPLRVSIRLGEPGAPAALGGEPPLPGAQASRPEQPAGGEAELRDALAELEASRRKDYYNPAVDKQDRDDYYKGLPKELSPTERYRRLSRLLKQTHSTPLKYQPGRHVYPWVDLQPGWKLRSVYSQKEYEPEEIIREAFRIDQELATRMNELLRAEAALGPERLREEIDLLEALRPYNCEHVVPQSWFGKREPMRGDLHHLFTCESGCNSFRGNTPYFDFPDYEEAVRTECGKREAVSAVGKGFEPSAGKGEAARATLYFLLRYPGEINLTSEEYTEERLRTLLAWHNANPLTEHEKHRNQAIFKKQGNRNPLVDFPDWAGRIDFTPGLG